jgi:hypothetical protein
MPTLLEMMETTYIKWNKDSPTTKKNKISRHYKINYWARYSFCRKTLGYITPKDIDKAIMDMENQQLQESTIRNYLSGLIRVFYYAGYGKTRYTNPAKAVLTSFKTGKIKDYLKNGAYYIRSQAY